MSKLTPPSSSGPGRGPLKAKTGVRVPLGASDPKMPPTDNVERFLSMLRFDSKGMLAELGIESDYLSNIKRGKRVRISFLLILYLGYTPRCIFLLHVTGIQKRYSQDPRLHILGG